MLFGLSCTYYIMLKSQKNNYSGESLKIKVFILN